MTDKIHKLEAKWAHLKSESGASVRDKVDVLIQLAWVWRYRKPKRTITLSQQAYELAEGAMYERGMALSLRNLGQSNLQLAQHEVALVYLKRALPIFEQLEELAQQAVVWHIRGVIYRQLANYLEALSAHFNELDLTRSTTDPSAEAKALREIGLIYHLRGDYEQALESYGQALKIFTQHNYVWGQMTVLNYLARTHAHVDDYDQARHCAEESLSLAQILDDPLAIIMTHETFGAIHLKMGQTEQALDYFQKYLAGVRTKMVCPYAELTALINLGWVYLQQKQWAEVRNYTKQAFAIAETKGMRLKLAECHQLLAALHEAKGAYKTALHHHKQFHRLKEMVFNEQAEREIQHSRVLYETGVARRKAAIYQSRNVELEQEVKERQAAEERLQAAEANLTALINSTNDIIWSIDKEHCVIAANETFIRTCHKYLKVEIIPGSMIFDLIDSQFVEEWKELYNRALQGERFTIELSYSFGLFEITFNPIIDTENNITGVTMFSREITTRQETEEKLRKLSRAVEQSGSAIVITNLDGQIEFVNPAFSKTTGYDIDEVIGRNPRILKSGHNPPAVYEKLWQTISQGQVWHGELLNKNKEGKLFWEFVTISPIKNKQGHTTHYIAIKEDITRRKKTEMALRESEARYRQMFESHSSIQLLLDPNNGDIVDANPAATNFYGYPLETLKQLNIDDINITPKSPQPKSLTSEQTNYVTFKQRLASGELRDIELHSGPVIVQGKRLLYAILHDITERKQAEEALAQREAHLATLVEVQQLLLAFKNDQLPYAEILSLLGHTSGVSRAYIFENELNNEQLVTNQKAEWCAANVKPQIYNPALQALPYKDMFSRWYENFLKGKPILGRVTDFPTIEQEFLKKQNIQSILVLPLMVNGRLEGFIGFDDCQKERQWTSSEIALLRAAATAISLIKEQQQAAEALHQVNEQLGSRLSELSTLNLIIQTLAIVTDLQFALETVAQTVIDLFNAQRSTIAMVNEEKTALNIVAHFSKRTEPNRVGQTISLLGNVSALRVFETRKSLVITQAQTNKLAEPFRDRVRELGTECILIVPLLTRGEVVGTIAIDLDHTPREFTTIEVNLAETIAGQIAGAIEISRLFEEEQRQRERAERRIEELSMLNQITQTVTTFTDLQGTLQIVAQLITEHFDNSGTVIGILDRNHTEIWLVAQHVAADPELQNLVDVRLPVPPNTPLQTMFVENRTIILNNNNATAWIRKQFPNRQVNTVMVVPLLARGEVIGSINIGSSKMNEAFDTTQIGLAETIAGQIAGAIENARLFDEEQRQRQVAESLREVATVLNSSLDLNTVLNKILEQLRRVIRYDSAAVFLLNQAEQHLHLSAGSDLIDENFRERTIPLDRHNKSLAIQALYAKEPLVIADLHEHVAEEETMWPHWEGNETIRAWMGAPLLFGQQPIGLLTTDSFAPNTYIDSDKQILQVFANQAAIAIQNARLFEEEQQQRQIAESLRQVATVLNSSLDQETVIAKILEQLRCVIDYDSAGLLLRENNMLILSDGVGVDEFYHHIPLDGDNLATQVFKQKEPLIVPDVHEIVEWEKSHADPRIRGWMAAPLLASGEVIGVLTVDNFQVAAYNQHDAQVLQIFADQAALAIQNARLFNEAEQARQAAETASRTKSTFLATMSHELRTPLNGILGYAQILRRDHNLKPHHHESLEIIERSGDHLLMLINDILDLAKIEVGKIELLHEEFHLLNFLQGVCEIIQIWVNRKGIEFQFQPFDFENNRPLTNDAQDNLPIFVRGDQKRLRQVLINLLGNAVKFTPQGSIMLRVGLVPPSQMTNVEPLHAAQRLIRFEVRDTGIGISEENLDLIFNPFQQVGDWQHKVEGTGLGLAICYNLVQLMGGSLRVKSKLSRGSSFWFNIPLVVLVENPLPPQAKRQSIIGFKDKREIKVLVVDDHWENRAMLANLLSPLGFDVFEASTGYEGLQKTVELRPQIVITDLLMPGIDGLEMIRRIRQRPFLNHCIIIANSASVFEADYQESLAAGCNYFLPKPIQAERLFEVLRKFLTLEWVYATPKQTETASLKYKSLPPEEIKRLQNLARIGDIRAIQEHAIRLGKIDEYFKPFAVEIAQLARTFQLKKIRQLLDSQNEDNT